MRGPSRLDDSVRERVEVVVGSHGDGAVVDEAFAGASAVFWLVPPGPVGLDYWITPGRSSGWDHSDRLFELYDVKPRQRAAADLHETACVMQSAEVDGRESHRVGKR